MTHRTMSKRSYHRATYRLIYVRMHTLSRPYIFLNFDALSLALRERLLLGNSLLLTFNPDSLTLPGVGAGAGGVLKLIQVCGVDNIISRYSIRY